MHHQHRCPVCGRQATRELRTIEGVYLGRYDEELCAVLLWASHFLRVSGASESEHAVNLWQWKRRRAEVEGRPFTESPPLSPAERELNAIIEARGWTDVAMELE